MLFKSILVKTRKLFLLRDGFGMNELLGIAAALILAAFIVIPGLRFFANNVMSGLGNWWTNEVASSIFPPA